ncbi:MAG: NUDIX hydrolase [Spirochaetaceae bacterium]|jgi:8-oxo-dGTP pyrophosphatase MutT (NUDIX family)|nr:NUDIX hydrolase [Spirochaetaceae bacterium]
MNTLKWREMSRKQVYDAKIFSVFETLCMAPDLLESWQGCAEPAHESGRRPEKRLERGTIPPNESVFTVIESRDWVIVVPVLKKERFDEFVMVRQWRHGALEESVEFPGGVVEAGEEAETAARRELREETGFVAGKLTKLATMSPNPAIMGNHVHFFLAEQLQFEGGQQLDKDEYVALEMCNVITLTEKMGKPPFIHALMAAALGFYHTHRALS